MTESLENGILDYEVEGPFDVQVMGKHVREVPTDFLQWGVNHLAQYVQWTQGLRSRKKRLNFDPKPWIELFRQELTRRGQSPTVGKSGWQPGGPTKHTVDPDEAPAPDNDAFAAIREVGLRRLGDEDVVKFDGKEFGQFKLTVEKAAKRDEAGEVFQTVYGGFGGVAPFEGYDGWLCYYNAEYGRCILERWEDGVQPEHTKTLEAIKSTESFVAKKSKQPGKEKALEAEDAVFRFHGNDMGEFDRLLEKWVEAKGSWQQNKDDSLYHTVLFRAMYLTTLANSGASWRKRPGIRH